MPRPKAIGALARIARPTERTTVSYGCSSRSGDTMRRADVLAQADHHHLEQAALDGAVIAGVRLDAADDADVVGLRGELVEIDGKAFGRGAELDDFHGRADGHADERLGDAVAFEDCALSFGGAAAVAAHGRHEERPGAEVLQNAGPTPLRTTGILAMPRLPAVRATVWPGLMNLPRLSLLNASRTACGILSTRGLAKC